MPISLSSETQEEKPRKVATDSGEASREQICAPLMGDYFNSGALIKGWLSKAALPKTSTSPSSAEPGSVTVAADSPERARPEDFNRVRGSRDAPDHPRVPREGAAEFLSPPRDGSSPTLFCQPEVTHLVPPGEDLQELRCHQGRNPPPLLPAVTDGLRSLQPQQSSWPPMELFTNEVSGKKMFPESPS